MSLSTRLTQAEIPMAEDRGTGWAFVRDRGRIVPVDTALWITHREEAEYVLHTPEIFSSEEAFAAQGVPIPMPPITFDPPKHSDYRRMLGPFFTPGAVLALQPRLSRQLDELIDSIAGKERSDVITDLAIPYPSAVFLTLFGLPLSDRDQLIAWKDAVMDASNHTAQGEEADNTKAMELLTYLGGAIQAKKANPGDDLLSSVLTRDDPLSDTEALGMAFLFVMAGLDTVTATIGFAFQYLATHPEVRDLLVAEPGRIPDFVEEIVRLEPPAPFLPRVTTRDTELAGTAIAKGTLVYVCIGSVNRDEGDAGENPRPDELVFDREVKRHWGFGGGPHRCLGSHLARLELKLVLERWHARIPSYRLEYGARPAIPWPADTFGLTTLPLVLSA